MSESEKLPQIYEKTFEVIESITDLKQSGETRTHIIYFCQNCESKRGKPDTDGKLYWSVEKNVGWCFKCCTVFYEEDSDGPAVNHELNNAVSKALTALTVIDYPDPGVLDFDFSDLNLSLLKFLRRKNPLLLHLIDQLHLRSWYGQLDGVVFPFFFKGKIVKFQVRFDTNDKLKRYYTMPGQKLPYSPTRVFDNFELKRESTVTICEGVFDAIALTIMGYPNPIAVLGSSVTDYQISLIRRLAPENAFIMMDNLKIGYAIKKSLEKVPSLSDIAVSGFGDLDPEEHLVSAIISDSEYLTQCLATIKNWSEL